MSKKLRCISTRITDSERAALERVKAKAGLNDSQLFRKALSAFVEAERELVNAGKSTSGAKAS